MSTPTPFDEEIDRFRRLAAEGSVNAMNDLAMALRDRSRYTGDPADLVEGVAQLRAAIGYVPDHPIRYPLLVGLSDLLTDQFQETGDLALLHEAMAGCDEAMPALDPDNRSTTAMLRAETLILLAKHTRELPIATEAVESAAQLPRLPPALYVHGKALRMLYELTYDHAVLIEAVGLLRASLDASSPEDPNYLLRLNQLGNALQLSAEHTGDDAVRQDAIRHLRRAVALSPAGFLTDHQVDLAAALRDRGRHTGDLEALREGVELLREVLAASPPDTWPWVNRCENYLVAAFDVVTRTGDLGLLDHAVATGQQARGRGKRKAMIPLLLGLLHLERFRRTGQETDLARAVGEFGGVVDSEPYGSPDHVVALGNLGRVWTERYRFSGEEEALRRAVTALGSAARASALDTSQRGEALVNYGDALVAQYEIGQDPGVLAAAGYAFREAAEIEALRPLARIKAARAWAHGEAETGNWRQAKDAYAFAMGMLPLVVSRRLSRVDQQQMLADLGGLAADAAAAAMAADDPATAVELLELGRGVLGGQVLQSRSDLSRLHGVAPDLAVRLSAAFDRLGASAPVTGVDADERHDADIRLLDLLRRARALPGFADFLAAPDLASLLSSTVDGPVVFVNVSVFRSDALIVAPSGVTPVALPGVTPHEVAERAAAFGAALAASIRPGGGEVDAQATITEILGWLWDHVAEPVLTRLGHTAPPSGQWPRVWWSPVGRLALLPIHAAGRFPGGASVVDRVVSSYIPTLRALRHARERVPRAVDDLVVVSVGDAPGAAALPGAHREAADIAKRTGATRLAGVEATTDAVRAALTTHTSAHFACHAVSDPDDPSAGYLLLRDGPLSVLDVSGLDLSGVRLAVLSACETSLGAGIPDESLHLVSAFQLAGYPQVVGTLWQVNDRVARLVAVDLHERVAAGEDVAEALHHVVRTCRERFARTPSLWAAYLHSGR
ncbi:CHAT domain-containing protein [Actinosynnema sp. NPDC002837]